ncbi:hypothetical protein PHLGIDRAFT_287083 [Phlebiopsis gigantea 11061_1 CR5-6]|uniref:Uncharacterized protein n=1 Tax=Phlebiopsis gigantea (strain 11061_1 CR5-6) TaxID=745531 RepID=A0A0C3PC20_PHLG1|nr:hypothetical protein PHLGIDRAFT_287083 [Phlebiopsis gigantea 11061_1 CR5-6]
MGRWSRRYTATVAISSLLICGTFYRFRNTNAPYDLATSFDDPATFAELADEQVQIIHPDPQLYPTDAPKLTIVAIWNPGTSSPLYLPNFFSSVAGNPTIDVLFIKDDRHEVGCDAPLAPAIPNLREVCLSSEEYWGLHADFLCEQWGGCSEHDRNRVMSKMRDRRWGDRVHAYFRPFRHEIFRRWLHPATPIWGVCDMDVVLGNFERNFPWDEALQYDIVFPSSPMDHEDVLVYIPGHLAFFANSHHLTEEFMTFPGVRTLDGFLSEPWMDSGAPDEAEWSHWAFTHTDLTFLRFPGLVVGQFHVSVPGAGVFSIDNAGYWTAMNRVTEPGHNRIRAALYWAAQQRARAPRKALFSSGGTERHVELRDGAAEGFLWFPQRFAVDVLVPPELITADWWQTKRFLMRRERGGPVVYRTEPMFADDWFVLPVEAFSDAYAPSVGFPMHAHDMLYNHFQVEKYTEWWKLPGLPARALGADEVLYVDKDRGAWVWDARGRVVFSAVL